MRDENQQRSANLGALALEAGLLGEALALLREVMKAKANGDEAFCALGRDEACQYLLGLLSGRAEALAEILDELALGPGSARPPARRGPGGPARPADGAAPSRRATAARSRA